MLLLLFAGFAERAKIPPRFRFRAGLVERRVLRRCLGFARFPLLKTTFVFPGFITVDPYPVITLRAAFLRRALVRGRCEDFRLDLNAARCREVPKNLICFALMRLFRFAAMRPPGFAMYVSRVAVATDHLRSEEHTSELQSPMY